MRDQPIQHTEEHLRQMQIEALALKLRQSFHMTVRESLKAAEEDIDYQRGPKQWNWDM